MPTLPGVDVSARIARGNGPRVNENVDPNAFGAGVGRAMQQFGSTVEQVGGQIAQVGEQKRQEQLANKVAQADFTPVEVQTRTEVGSDASGYADAISMKYDDWVEKQAGGITDDWTRMKFREQMYADKRNVTSRAALYQENQSTLASKDQADASLQALQNKVTLDPLQYDKLAAQGAAVLATRPGMTATQVQIMQTQFKQNLAKARFDGMLENAQTPEDVDAVEADLKNDPKWAQTLAKPDLDNVESNIKTERSAILTKADADARAAIDTLDERNTGLQAIPPDEMSVVAGVVKSSRNPVLIGKFARIQRDQSMIKQFGGSSPQVMTDAIKETGGVQYPNLPADYSSYVNDATSRFNVSASMLGGTVERESGGNPNAKSSTSSASGLTQFTDSTWLGVMKDPVTQKRMGIDLSGKSDAEILAMRGDPHTAILATAALAEKNKDYLSLKLGRDPDDAEVYMAHFLGADGAYGLIDANTKNPNQSAVSVVGNKVALANRNIFYSHSGKEKSIGEVYNSIARDFTFQPSQAQYGDVKTLDGMRKAADAGLKSDPMAWAQNTGKFDVQPLTDASSYQSRAATARSVAGYYNIPMSDFQPLTQQETVKIQQAMDSGNADETLAVMANVQQLGGDVAKAAFKQLGEKDKVYAYAAGLATEGGSPTVASDVVRGRKLLENNDTIEAQVGTKAEIDNEFNKLVVGSLSGLAPDQQQAIHDAALAHYVQTYTSRGIAGINDQQFQASIDVVMGGTPGKPGIGIINGQPTAMPKGVDPQTFEKAVDNMEPEDWINMSPQKTPPLFITGEVVSPETMAQEARFRSIGGGLYKVQFDDGTYAWTGKVDTTGRPAAYLFQPTADSLKSVNDKRDVELNTPINQLGAP